MRERADGFLNVDLEVGARTRAPLAPLLAAFEAELFELFRGRIGGLYRAHFQSNPRRSGASATIRDLVAVIERLRPAARRAWADAAMRDFNVGVELAPGVRHVEHAIAVDVVHQVAALGGRIVFTAYQVAAMRTTQLTAARKGGSR